MPTLVLVHGNAHSADCWDLTVDEIHRLAPELTVLAVDLPGRRSKPVDLRTLTIADFVDSVVADIEDGPSPVTEVRVLQWSPARTTPIHGRPAPSGCIAYSGGDGVAS
jgi:hypothetical protein